jgi:hypothetical protein
MQIGNELDEKPLAPNDAIFSFDGRHRYLLQRTLVELNGRQSKDLRTLGLFMVNPSTAGAEVQDPTIRRVMGFAQRWGYERVLVGNKFAYKGTDIDDLKHLPLAEAVGEFNDLYLSGIAHCSEQVVVAWGPLAKLPPRLRERWKDVVRVLDERNKVPYCIGATAKDGHPRHPLMLKYDEPLVPWNVPWFPNRYPIPAPECTSDFPCTVPCPHCPARETQEARNARADREADTAHASGYLASDAH